MSSIRVFLIALMISASLAGCANFISFKNKALQGTSQKQVGQSNQNKGIKKQSPRKVVIQAPSSNCSYIVRDLSVPNATAIWCVPSVLHK